MIELTPEQDRAAIQRALRGKPLGPIVDRWFQGEPVDRLAADLNVRRDVLWALLEPAITARTRQAEQGPQREERTS